MKNVRSALLKCSALSVRLLTLPPGLDTVRSSVGRPYRQDKERLCPFSCDYYLWLHVIIDASSLCIISDKVTVSCSEERGVRSNSQGICAGKDGRSAEDGGSYLWEPPCNSQGHLYCLMQSFLVLLS